MSNPKGWQTQRSCRVTSNAPFVGPWSIPRPNARGKEVILNATNVFSCSYQLMLHTLLSKANILKAENMGTGGEIANTRNHATNVCEEVL